MEYGGRGFGGKRRGYRKEAGLEGQKCNFEGREGDGLECKGQSGREEWVWRAARNLDGRIC